MIVCKRFLALVFPLSLVLLSACGPWNPPFGQFIDDQLRYAREAKGGTASGGYEITFSKPPDTIPSGETMSVEVNSSKEAESAVYTIYLNTNPIYYSVDRLPQTVSFPIPGSYKTGPCTLTMIVEIGGSNYSGSFPLNITSSPPGTYTVTFNTQGGGSIPRQTVNPGSTLSYPERPSGMSGYDIEGWYTDSACTNPWNFVTNTITADRTLYAKWATYDELDFPGATLNPPEDITTGGTMLYDYLRTIRTSPGNYVINLHGGQTHSFPGSITLGSGVNISLRGNASDIVAITGDFSMFTIDIGAKLILCGPTLRGSVSNTGSLVVVEGDFYLRSGLITGNTARDLAGGVLVSGTFTMTGGTISGNTGDDAGGMLVWRGGIFSMSGGTVSGNTSDSDDGGGVYIADGSTFTMTGGTISNNTGDAGGGVFFDSSGDFTMSGGSISGNNADGSGGGVYIDGSNFTMTGGVISGNTSDGQAGGGVYVGGGGSFAMSGGAVSGNTVDSGGGVAVVNGTFAMSGGVVSGNHTNYSGGGVAVATSGIFIKSGGAITGTDGPNPNTAVGDGVAVYSIVGGAKYRNTTAGPGVGVNTGTDSAPDGTGFWQH